MSEGKGRRLHVRNVPDELHEALKRSAEMHGRSLSAEFVAIMRRELAGDIAEQRARADRPPHEDP
jgi:plasmid stability protein